MSSLATPRPNAGIGRWAALGGVAYVVLFVIGVILIFGNSPDSSRAPVLVAIWILVVSIGMFVRAGRTPTAVAA